MLGVGVLVEGEVRDEPCDVLIQGVDLNSGHMIKIGFFLSEEDKAIEEVQKSESGDDATSEINVQ